MKLSVGDILRFWLGLGMIILAYSIIQFSNTLIKVNKNIPKIVHQVSLINQKVDTITIKSIPNILEAVPRITNQIDSIDSKIPLLLSEVGKIRNTTIPMILSEINTIRKTTVPNVLEHVDSINKQIPSILKRIDSSNEQIPNITSVIDQSLIRIDSINKQIPEVLSMVRVTNDSITSYIDQAEALITNAEEVANVAGKNASQGFLGGIITTPFSLVRDLGNFAFEGIDKLSNEEAIAIEDEVFRFLNKNTEAKEQDWVNDVTKRSGQIKVLRNYQKKGRKIKKLRITFDNSKESINAHFAQEKNGEWSYWK